MRVRRSAGTLAFGYPPRLLRDVPSSAYRTGCSWHGPALGPPQRTRCSKVLACSSRILDL